MSLRSPTGSALLAVLSLIFCVSCQDEAQPLARTQTDVKLFGPVSMRLHPIFTQVKSWSGDTRPEGIEALVELQDQFGDPTKASGRIIFELYTYKPYDPERRGERLAVWNDAYLQTLDEQRDRWNRTSRTYGFQLTYPQIQPTQSYVLTAEFQLAGGGRFFDQVILEGKSARQDSGDNNAFPALPALPGTQPATTQPATRP
jgi:hypothetical protein